MPSNPVIPQVNRAMVGVCAVACLGIGLVTYFALPEYQGTQGAFVRVGLLMGALWFAHPLLGRTRVLEVLGPLIFAGAVIVGVVKKASLVVIPLIVVIALFSVLTRPKGRRGASSG